MNQNPYAAPVSTSSVTDLQSPATKSALNMYAKHAIFLFLVGAAVTVGGPLLISYVVAAKIPKLAAPSLLVLQLSIWFAKFWHYALILAPLYYLFLVALTYADKAIVGLRRAWSVIFWAIATLFTAAIAFGFVLPFL